MSARFINIINFIQNYKLALLLLLTLSIGYFMFPIIYDYFFFVRAHFKEKIPVWKTRFSVYLKIYGMLQKLRKENDTLKLRNRELRQNNEGLLYLWKNGHSDITKPFHQNPIPEIDPKLDFLPSKIKSTEPKEKLSGPKEKWFDQTDI